MAKIKYGVEGFEGVQRKSDRLYSHAVVAVPDVVCRAESMLVWAKSEQSRKNAKWSYIYAEKIVEAGVGGCFVPVGWNFSKGVSAKDVDDSVAHLDKYPSAQAVIDEMILAHEEGLQRAVQAAPGIQPEVVSFSSSYALAAKAAAILRKKGGMWLNVEVREVFPI